MKAYLAVCISLLLVLAAVPARAISIHDFGRMNDDDDATYISLLVEGASKYLKAQNQPEKAAKVIAFFKNPGKNGGVNQFAMNLKALESQNNRNAINPNNRAPAYEIEDAMALTLKDNEIIVPVAYLKAIGRDFRAIGPPRSHAAGT